MYKLIKWCVLYLYNIRVWNLILEKNIYMIINKKKNILLYNAIFIKAIMYYYECNDTYVL